MKYNGMVLMSAAIVMLVACAATSAAPPLDALAEDPIARVSHLLHVGSDMPFSLAADLSDGDGNENVLDERNNDSRLKLDTTLFKPDNEAQFHYANLYVPAEKSASNLRMSSNISGPTDSLLAPMAVYVWDSHDLISKQQYTDEFWKGLNKLAISRLLLSLDSAQITRAQTNPDSLRNFLSAARKHGIAVELLLGEPTWITAPGRAQLASLIKSLDSFDFAGLNLDIEPDQIYRQPLSHQQFDDWLATLKLAAQTAPWPTALSVHPRYFRDAPYTGWRFAQRLRDAGIGEVVLMIYNSNPQKVAQIAKPITGSAAGLRFRIAQSVEAGLDAKESHAGRSPEEFQKTMHQLQGLLATQSNTEGIVLQAWADLMRMGYENQIR